MAISRISQSTVQAGFPKFNNTWDGLSAVGSMEPISAITLASASANIEFNNIPQTYSHLQVRGILKANRTGSLSTGWAWLRVNGNLGARYHALSATGSSFNLFGLVPSQSNGYQISATGSASGSENTFAPVLLDFLDYSNTNKNKTVRILSGADTNSEGLVLFSSYLVNSTSAITSISIGGADSTDLLQYSSLSLYGIK